MDRKSVRATLRASLLNATRGVPTQIKWPKFQTEYRVARYVGNLVFVNAIVKCSPQFCLGSCKSSRIGLSHWQTWQKSQNENQQNIVYEVQTTLYGIATRVPRGEGRLQPHSTHTHTEPEISNFQSKPVRHCPLCGSYRFPALLPPPPPRRNLIYVPRRS